MKKNQKITFEKKSKIEVQEYDVAIPLELVTKLKGIGTFFEKEIEIKNRNKDSFLIGKGVEKCFETLIKENTIKSFL